LEAFGLKITIFGLTISSSWGNGHATPYRAIIKALYRQGHKVEFFEKNVPYYSKHRDFRQSDYCSLHLYPNWDSIRSSALRVAGDSDAVICASFCPDGARIIDDILILSDPAKIFYDLDTPVTLGRLERGDVDYLRREQIPEFDLYLSFTGGGTIDELRSVWSAKRAAPLYGCVDPEVHSRVEVPQQYCSDFSYMGTYAADRQAKLEAFFLQPARRLPANTFVLAGSMYPWDWQLPANVRRFEHVSASDHSALYSSSRLTLNITRNEMARWGYCLSGRFFEAAACGTPIVTDRFEGLDTFFDCGRELLVVDSTEDVISAIELPDSELSAIARRARERILDQHTGKHRAHELVAAIENIGTATRLQKARSEVA
jgi:spore maturation protein CgeB